MNPWTYEDLETLAQDIRDFVSDYPGAAGDEESLLLYISDAMVDASSEQEET